MKLMEKCIAAVVDVKTKRGAAPPSGWTGDFQEYWDETTSQKVYETVRTTLEDLSAEVSHIGNFSNMISKYAKKNGIELRGTNDQQSTNHTEKNADV